MNEDKERKAIARLQEAALHSERMYDAPLIVTNSGGKDSDLCLALAKRAGIRYEVLHKHTTADAPETVYHIRETFRQLKEQGIVCAIQKPVYKSVPVTMWSLIPQKCIPPTRLARYCCEILKSHGIANRFVVTGVRWAESTARRNSRAAFEKPHRNREKRILLNDNDDRRMIEHCGMKSRWICNPIIDWTDEDVWAYIEAEHIPINPLYKYGFRRVGCIGCPLAPTQRRYAEFARYPQYQKAYIRAFDRMLAMRTARGLPTEWQTGEDVFHWWLEDGVLTGQISFDDLDA